MAEHLRDLDVVEFVRAVAKSDGGEWAAGTVLNPPVGDRALAEVADDYGQTLDFDDAPVDALRVAPA